MLERNWKERAYREEIAKEKARIFVRNEVEKSKPKKRRSLAGYISYMAIGVIIFAFIYYFGSFFELSVAALFDQSYILILLFIFGLFYASMKNWI